MGTDIPNMHRRIARRQADKSIVRLSMTDSAGQVRCVTAQLLDLSNNGFGLSLMTCLAPGTTLTARGNFGENRTGRQVLATVRWCAEAGGCFRTGLEFVDQQPQERAERVESVSAAAAPGDPNDYYELLQLSPHADHDTISRVYRILAARYHPDNSESGNNDIFVRLTQAYRVLSDPEKRASYDAAHTARTSKQWKLFDKDRSDSGPDSERTKRHAILAALYTLTLNDPDDAGLTIQNLEELLGCPREHLQAAVWFLKGKDFIRRSDNGRFTITIAGFEEAEAHSVRVIDKAHRLNAAADAPFG